MREFTFIVFECTFIISGGEFIVMMTPSVPARASAEETQPFYSSLKGFYEELFLSSWVCRQVVMFVVR
jgi:hypothetical protein